MNTSATSHDRFIPISGMQNVRDFGGYETLDGRRIRRGLLFRSGFPGRIGSQGQAQFAQLDLHIVCDLRRDDELVENPPPDYLPLDRRVHVPIAPGSSVLMRAAIGQGASVAEVIAYMTRITREIAGEHLESYARVFEHLLNCQGGFLLHCSAGKDRTGFGVALIQAALGVDLATIYQDYLLSNANLDYSPETCERYSRYFGRDLDEDRFRALAGVRREYLDAALEEVLRQCGSLLGYLDAIGVDETRRRTLQDRLLEDSWSLNPRISSVQVPIDRRSEQRLEVSALKSLRLMQTPLPGEVCPVPI